MISLFRKNLYNKRSAKKLGWVPLWFGAEKFDEVLILKITDFQHRYDLEPDGLCGPTTHRRLLTERDAARNPMRSHIICDGEPIEIDWDRVVNLNDSGSLVLPKNCYRSSLRPDPSMIVTHFDVCLSAESCKRVLEKRGISSHFVIDNDGTIYQMVDTAYEAWHAGNRLWNRKSIGVDLSNAIYLKYQKTYVARGHGARPVIKNLKVHGGTIKECLGFYDVQIEAYKALIACLCEKYKIPLECPVDDAGDTLMKVSAEAERGKFSGVVSHYHLTRRKWDTANLNLVKVLKEIQ